MQHVAHRTSDEIHCLRRENDLLRDALERIEAWGRAYPLKAFPEPDFAKAAKLLSDGGITLDAVSASNMRHVIQTVALIAREALKGSKT
jgi:hypothetical protein